MPVKRRSVQLLERLPPNQLSLKYQFMGLYLFLRKCNPKHSFLRKCNPKQSKKKETAREVIEAVLSIWNRAYIEAKLWCQLVSELRDIVKLYLNFQRHPERLETNFWKTCEEMWDIKKKNAKFRNEGDLKFYIDQKRERERMNGDWTLKT